MDPAWVKAAAALVLAAAGAGANAADEVAVPRWEINLDAIGTRNGNGWTIAEPAAEVFYQLNRQVQLTANTSWTISRPYGARPTSGLGTGTAGFKLFLLNERTASVALWPQLERGLTAASVRRGLASANRAFALPVEAKFSARGIDYELTAGRTFIEAEEDQWNATLKAIRHCLPRADCVLQADHSYARGLARQTLLMLGAEWKLSDALTLKTSAGRELGKPGREQDNLALLVGLKIVY
jgi:hypothetical protein